mmetsp:Transcript_11816/g.34898  ORF Transcript_11816/g.34898 Transcript_11816/m.34898 type:complete len:213 (+) Transcript_11816:93-731(+)
MGAATAWLTRAKASTACRARRACPRRCRGSWRAASSASARGSARQSCTWATTTCQTRCTSSTSTHRSRASSTPWCWSWIRCPSWGATPISPPTCRPSLAQWRGRAAPSCSTFAAMRLTARAPTTSLTLAAASTAASRAHGIGAPSWRRRTTSLCSSLLASLALTATSSDLMRRRRGEGLRPRRRAHVAAAAKPVICFTGNYLHTKVSRRIWL